MATPITGNALRPRDERKWLTAGSQTLVIVMSALGQKRTYAVQKSMTALPPIATAKADFRTGPCPLHPQKRTCAVH
jgi:hypothetical protein